MSIGNVNSTGFLTANLIGATGRPPGSKDELPVNGLKLWGLNQTYVPIELWSMNVDWEQLTVSGCQAQVERLGNGTRTIIEEEHIEVTGWGFSEQVDTHADGHAYFSVWRAPSRDGLHRPAFAIENGGWYRYVDQHNVFGALSPPDSIITKLIE